MKRIFILLKLCLLLSPAYCQVINKAEYFIDVDLGFGQCTPIPVSSPGANIDIPIAVPPSVLQNLTPGWHKLYMRTRDNTGKWSHTHVFPFETIGAVNNNLIVAAEYFIDEDPGFGEGNTIPMSTPSANMDIPINISEDDLQQVSVGWHKLYFRTRDLNGKWSHTHMFPFEKIGWQDENLVVGAEYFFDTDPGVGEAPYIAFANPITNAQVTISIPAEDVPTGSHWLYIRTRDINGEWSHTHRIQQNFSVVNFVAGTLQQNNQTICWNTIPTGVGFNIPAGGSNLQYQWYRRIGIQTASGGFVNWTQILGATEATYTPTEPLTASTTYACWVTSTGGESWASGQMQVTVLPQLNYGTIANANQTLSSPADPAQIGFSASPAGSGSFTYQWYYQNGISSTPANCQTTGWTSIAGATSATYNPPNGLTQNRSYACFVTPIGNPDCGDGCWANGVRQISITTVGIEDINGLGVRIYPNPATDILTIEQNEMNINALAIYDAQGRLVKEQLLNGTKTIVIINELSSGLYSVRLMGNETHFIKIVKQ